MVVEQGELSAGTLGVSEDLTIGGDQCDARGRRLRDARHELACHPRIWPRCQQIRRLRMEHGADRREAGGERFRRELIERPREVEPSDQRRDGHEPDERERELERDATPDEPQQRPHQLSASSRYPSPLTVTIRPPSPPSLTRRRRTWTSTVRDLISPAAGYPQTGSRRCSRERTRP